MRSHQDKNTFLLDSTMLFDQSGWIKSNQKSWLPHGNRTFKMTAVLPISNNAVQQKTKIENRSCREQIFHHDLTQVSVHPATQFNTVFPKAISTIQRSEKADNEQVVKETIRQYIIKNNYNYESVSADQLVDTMYQYMNENGLDLEEVAELLGLKQSQQGIQNVNSPQRSSQKTKKPKSPSSLSVTGTNLPTGPTPANPTKLGFGNVWAGGAASLPKSSIPVSNPSAKAAKTSHVLQAIKDKLLNWDRSSQGGGPPAQLNEQEIKELIQYAKQQTSRSGSTQAFSILDTSGEQKYSGRRVIKIISNNSKTNPKATFHVQIYGTENNGQTYSEQV